MKKLAILRSLTSVCPSVRSSDVINFKFMVFYVYEHYINIQYIDVYKMFIVSMYVLYVCVCVFFQKNYFSRRKQFFEFFYVCVFVVFERKSIFQKFKRYVDFSIFLCVFKNEVKRGFFRKKK